MPSLPQNTTPLGERQQIMDELEKERVATPSQAPAPGVRRPAVPPRPEPNPSPAPKTSSAPSGCGDDTALKIAVAVPPLRGTLHGDWRPSPAVAPMPQGTGITASIHKAESGPLAIGFETGSSELATADLARLKELAGAFLTQSGEGILIRARGGSVPGPGPRPLASLSLGLQRASSIADALIADGVAADRIKIAAEGDEAMPAVAGPDWGKSGNDGALVVLLPRKP